MNDTISHKELGHKFFGISKTKFGDSNIITIRLLMFELSICSKYGKSVSVDIYFRLRLLAVIEARLGFTVY